MCKYVAAFVCSIYMTMGLYKLRDRAYTYTCRLEYLTIDIVSGFTKIRSQQVADNDDYDCIRK